MRPIFVLWKLARVFRLLCSDCECVCVLCSVVEAWMGIRIAMAEKHKDYLSLARNRCSVCLCVSLWCDAAGPGI